MILVTGGLGFIGYNLIKHLNSKGIDQIVIVENIKKSKTMDIKLKKLQNIDFIDLIDREDIDRLLESEIQKIECIFHFGACTDTTETDFKYLFENNYEFTKKLLDKAYSKGIRMIYASSASVYGNKNYAVSEEDNPEPLNYYAYSKFLVDKYFIRKILSKGKSRIVGLRYFNVYGPHEENKINMSSVILKFFNQLKNEGKLYLFEGSENFKRDFIYIEDVTKINVFFMENNYEGIYNCGTGKSESFLKVAQIIIEKMGFGQICYIPFPENLKNKYQTFTQANNQKLRNIIDIEFTPVQKGIENYLSYLLENYG
ncbi:MAG: ADP-glyceromanno-heptose 6-epimerase [Candidatus Calescibacterium sp.]|nr:ADP-glyceromanno-heptose 6-epimerase [Candidatus Calescibacterium sp.]MCX7972350.1 ADP-glyceromanno-heptose 6-epimerase [bacterium]MDW8195929.1 ADP-glyceromanno-heptose 6-epimerase [Candidatus Calescibacterium sp.]